MEKFGKDRRHFLRSTGSALLTSGVVSALALSSGSVRAANHEAVTQTQKTQAVMTPQKALEMLKAGNDRFVQGKMLQRDYRQQIKATAGGQFPFAAIVGCIDSRESAQLVFDQGIGDVFSARIAGNFVNNDILGRLEFACKVAGAKLIVVLGHTECGAVKGACDDVVMGKPRQYIVYLSASLSRLDI